jgi:hypothetical protein
MYDLLALEEASECGSLLAHLVKSHHKASLGSLFVRSCHTCRSGHRLETRDNVRAGLRVLARLTLRYNPARLSRGGVRSQR